MRFNIGDKAVYPAHGVAEIKAIESKEVSGAKMDFYVLQIVSSGARLMVPTLASERAGMRGLISSDEIDNVYTILREPGHVSQRAWNRRFREFSEKLRASSVNEIAEVLRDLWALQSQKELSYGEKQMLEKAMDLLKDEICASQGKASADIENEIRTCLQAQVG